MRHVAPNIGRIRTASSVSQLSLNTKMVHRNKTWRFEGVPFGYSDLPSSSRFPNKALILESLGCRRVSNLQTEIDDIFLGDHDINLKINNLIKHRLHECDPKTISSLMRLTGRESRNESFTVLRDNLPAIASQLQSISTSNSWNTDDIAYVICGMQCMKEDDPGVADVVSLMTKLANLQLQRGHIVTPDNIRMFCEGLQNMQCKEEETKNLMQLLRSMIESCDRSFSSGIVFSILSGMQKMGYNGVEVTTIMTAMINKIEPLESTDAAKEFSALLHGLQIRNMYSPQLRAVLDALDPLSPRNNSPKLRQEEIDSLFSAVNDTTTTNIVDNFIKTRLHECGVKNICNLVRIAGRESRNKSFTALRDNLPALASQLQTISTSSSWSFRYISMTIFGMQCMKEEDPGVPDIISLMTTLAIEQVRKGEVIVASDIATLLLGLQLMQCDGFQAMRLLSFTANMVRECSSFDDSTISNSFYALQHTSCDNPIVRDLVEALTDKIKDSDLVLSAHSIALIVYGLRCMDDNAPEVSAAMKALTSKAGASTAQLTSADISLILNGLRNRSSEVSEVCQLVKALAILIRRSPEPLQAHAIRLMNGLNKMTSDSPEVLELIEALVPKIRNCTEVLCPEDVGDALYGMQGLDSDIPSVQLLLTAFTPLVRECTGIFTEMNLSMSMYGMRRMSNYNPEVCDLIAALVPKVRLCQEPFTPIGIANSLYGLQGTLNNSPEVYALLNALLPKIANCKEELMPRHIGSALFGLRRMDSNLPGVCEILWCLARKIHSCQGEFCGRSMVNSLFGLQRMGNNSADVRNLLSALTLKMAKCTEPFDGRLVSNGLYGLRSMNCDDVEVRDMLTALLPKVDHCTETLSKYQMHLSLTGLQNMNPDRPEVAALLRSLADASLEMRVSIPRGGIQPEQQNDDETLYRLLDETIIDPDI